MSAHTPGPWVIGNESNDCCDVDTGKTTISLDRIEPHSCKVIIDRDEMLANARLIAAAPDLLAVVEELIERRARVVATQGGSADGSDGRYARARAAIAKARGGK